MNDRAKPNRTGQENFAIHVLWAKDNKDSIQKSIVEGKTIADYAKEKGIARETMTRVFRLCDIRCGRDIPADAKRSQLDAVTIVLARLCDGKVPYDELKPFLPKTEDGQLL